MSIDLAAEVRAYLDTVEAAQQSLGSLGTRKHAALRTADAPALERIADEEAAGVVELRRRLGDRAHLLSRARVDGHPVTSITELVDRLAARDAAAGARLRDRLERARETARRLQRETWVHWIVARRSVAQYGELLELIANHGRRAATYAGTSRRDAADGAAGGAVLDTSA